MAKNVAKKEKKEAKNKANYLNFNDSWPVLQCIFTKVLFKRHILRYSDEHYKLVPNASNSISIFNFEQVNAG